MQVRNSLIRPTVLLIINEHIWNELRLIGGVDFCLHKTSTEQVDSRGEVLEVGITHTDGQVCLCGGIQLEVVTGKSNVLKAGTSCSVSLWHLFATGCLVSTLLPVIHLTFLTAIEDFLALRALAVGAVLQTAVALSQQPGLSF